MEDNIQVTKSRGGTCFKCERAIKSGERVIRFSFNVNIILMKHRMSEEAHLNCAGEFHLLLGQRIAEAFKR